ncbi:MAG: carbamate kinase [Firmicutes bacterium]|nr:carbamate kinase [Bacillota bacterium]
MKTIVVALGGNALGNNPQEQIEKVAHAVKPIADLIEDGHQVILAHGNGPQVGMINLAFEVATNHSDVTPAMPFPECGAMSQGYIGYHLQNALQEELRNRGFDKHVATIITQVEVDPKDSAFQHPSKPIGSFYSKEESEKLASLRGYVMIEDASRGYRRVVPSPIPVKIVELEVIHSLIKEGHVVITVGGGGIPVIKDNNKFIGVAAVIDKDFASATLADQINADSLVILTAIDQIKLNYKTPQEISIRDISVKELKNHIKENHFLKGSMLPKVQAAISFVEKKPGRTAIIASLDEAKAAIEGNAGTLIHL